MEDNLFGNFVRGEISEKTYEKLKKDAPWVHIGQRVIGCKEHDGKREIINAKGTIRIINHRGEIGIEWDENVHGHDLNGTVEHGYGWYVTHQSIKPLIEEEK